MAVGGTNTTNAANGDNALPTYADPGNPLIQYPTYLIPGQNNPTLAVIPAPTALGASGTLFKMTFDANGKLTAPTTNPTLTLTSSNTAVGAFTVEFDISKATQYGTSFAVSNLTQDGYTAGELTGLNIDQTGLITSRYSNGQTQFSGQVTLADFRNVQGLSPLGGNTWGANFVSGQPVQGAHGAGKFGGLRAGALEDSNVDLTSELVNMMTAQRAYQANAQTIKTQDQVLSTLVNLR